MEYCWYIYSEMFLKSHGNDKVFFPKHYKGCSIYCTIYNQRLHTVNSIWTMSHFSAWRLVICVTWSIQEAELLILQSWNTGICVQKQGIGTGTLNSYLRSIWCGFVYVDFSMVQLFRNILEMTWDHGQSHELNLSYLMSGTMRKKFS